MRWTRSQIWHKERGVDGYFMLFRKGHIVHREQQIEEAVLEGMSVSSQLAASLPAQAGVGAHERDLTALSARQGPTHWTDEDGHPLPRVSPPAVLE